jgi:hypothetical protein
MGSVPETIAALATALKFKFITKAEHDNRMLTLKGPDNLHLQVFAAGPKGCGTGRKGQWNTIAGPYVSMQEGKDALHAQPPIQGVPVAWKYSRSGGGSEHQAKFDCRAHVKCDFQVRVVIQGGQFFLQQRAGAVHNYAQPNERVGLIMTPAQYNRVRVRVMYLDVFIVYS